MFPVALNRNSNYLANCAKSVRLQFSKTTRNETNTFDTKSTTIHNVKRFVKFLVLTLLTKSLIIVIEIAPVSLSFLSSVIPLLLDIGSASLTCR